jgi:hypothetical protein
MLKVVTFVSIYKIDPIHDLEALHNAGLVHRDFHSIQLLKKKMVFTVLCNVLLLLIFRYYYGAEVAYADKNTQRDARLALKIIKDHRHPRVPELLS